MPAVGIFRAASDEIDYSQRWTLEGKSRAFVILLFRIGSVLVDIVWKHLRGVLFIQGFAPMRTLNPPIDHRRVQFRLKRFLRTLDHDWPWLFACNRNPTLDDLTGRTVFVSF